MKRCLIGAVVLVLLLNTSTFAYNIIDGENLPTIRLILNGKENKKTTALMYKDKTYIPLDAFRKLQLDGYNKASVDYDEETKAIKIIWNKKKSEERLEFYIENSVVTCNRVFTNSNLQQSRTLESFNAYIINKDGYNYIPISILRDFLDIAVYWDGTERIVSIPGELYNAVYPEERHNFEVIKGTLNKLETINIDTLSDEECLEYLKIFKECITKFNDAEKATIIEKLGEYGYKAILKLAQNVYIPSDEELINIQEEREQQKIELTENKDKVEVIEEKLEEWYIKSYQYQLKLFIGKLNKLASITQYMKYIDGNKSQYCYEELQIKFYQALELIQIDKFNQDNDEDADDGESDIKIDFEVDYISQSSMLSLCRYFVDQVNDNGSTLNDAFISTCNNYINQLIKADREELK